jgi:uncharacterized protein YjbJ (UPF0337 family)
MARIRVIDYPEKVSARSPHQRGAASRSQVRVGSGCVGNAGRVTGGDRMSDAQDKLRNKAQELRGKAKEQGGKLTDNERQEAEGRAEQAKADVKQAGEKVKDAFDR